MSTSDRGTIYSVYSSVTGTVAFQYNTATEEYTSYVTLGPVTARFNEGKEGFTSFGEARYKPELNWDKPSFTGHVADSATGLTYMQARYYDPVIGRFLSTDPIGYQDQLNLYAYVHNDPVNMMDPTGMLSMRKLGAAFGRAGGRDAFAGAAAIADTPAPGPGDAVGAVVAIGITALLVWDIGDAIISSSDDQSDTGPAGPVNPPKVEDFETPDSIPDDWEWRGKGEAGGREGAYHNPDTGESLHDDRTHPEGKDPHWTYTDEDGKRWGVPGQDREKWKPQ